MAGCLAPATGLDRTLNAHVPESSTKSSTTNFNSGTPNDDRIHRPGRAAAPYPRQARRAHRRRARCRQLHYGARSFQARSEEHTSELQSLMRISYAVFCLKKKKQDINKTTYRSNNVH